MIFLPYFNSEVVIMGMSFSHALKLLLALLFILVGDFLKLGVIYGVFFVSFWLSTDQLHYKFQGVPENISLFPHIVHLTTKEY